MKTYIQNNFSAMVFGQLQELNLDYELIREQAEDKFTEIEGLENSKTLKTLKLNNHNVLKISNLDNIPALVHLEISHNRIRIIEGLENQEKLEILDLSFNEILRLENLGHLTGLKYLLLTHNCIKKIENISTLQNLKSLHLSSNRGINVIENLNHLHTLESLYLKNCLVAQWEGLSEAINLRELFISPREKIETDVLCKLKKLKRLHLSSRELSYINSFYEMPTLEELTINGCWYLTKVSGLENLTGLKKLTMVSNNLTDISGIQPLQNLEELDLKMNGIRYIEIIERNFPKLKKFNINGNPLEKSQSKILERLKERGVEVGF